ncbi:hypothetical protein QTP88_000942 [Uroleucon formosanum]
MQNLEELCVIVMDNCPYHSVQVQNYPKSNDNKATFQIWLKENGVEFNSFETLSELQKRVKHLKPKDKRYELDEIALQMGHEVIRLPPYHCQYNSIELIWAQVKGEIANKNNSFKITDVEDLANIAIENVTVDNWKRCVDHCERLQNEDYIKEGFRDQILESIILTINPEDSNLSKQDEIIPSMFAQSLKVTAEACGLSERTVRRICKEGKDSLDSDQQVASFKSPRKTYKRAKPLTELDDFDADIVRRVVHEFYDRDPAETQKKFNEGTNLENEPENIKKLVQVEQNLKNKFKKSDLSHSEKKLNNLRKDEYEDEYEDEYCVKKLQEKEYSPANLEKIINIEKKLKSNYRKRVIDDRHSAEEKIKNFEPILEGLSKVEKSINNVKEVAIKTDNDIQRLIPTTTTTYRPRNPDVLRLLSTDDYENDQTPKSSPIKIKNSSPLPPDTILGKYSSTALASLPKNNAFGINFNTDTKQYSIGKEIVTFNLNNIILKGNERKITPGMWCLLTESNVPNANDYTKEDLDKYKQLLIETDSIYKNNDRSTGGAKSSVGDKYMKLISPIWKEIKGEKTPTTPTEILNPTIPDFPTIPITSKPKNPTIPTTEILKPTILTTDILKPTIATENKGAGLMNYTNNEIEYCWIDNMKQLNERLHLIAAEEKAGNYIYHNEKLGILKLFKKKMEHLIDDRKGIEYLLQFVINLPKEIPNDIEYVIKQLREKIYYISNEERLGNNIYHNDKIEILNFCIKKMEKVIDIPDKGPLYL